MGAKKPRTTTETLKKLAMAEHKRAHTQVLARLNDPLGAHFERHDPTLALGLWRGGLCAVSPAR
jgi:hypothetical protein